MPIWLSQSPLLATILILAALSFVTSAVLLYLYKGQAKRSQSVNELIVQSNEVLQRLSNQLVDSQKSLDERLAREQQQLFQNLRQDRESQLTSISELRVELEKRFAESSRVLAQNIQEFQTQMVERFEKLQRASSTSLYEGQQKLTSTVNDFSEKIGKSMERYQSETKDAIVENLRKGLVELRSDLDLSIKRQNESISVSLSGLTETTDKRLLEISGQVEKRLSEGFDKTTKTFNDVLERLALIDDAQKKITELSTNVVSLQEILNDKRSRGAFGEVQLQSLVSNIMPDSHYSMQQKLSNDKIVDCLLKLPEPTGSIAIDAKFPLESYKKMMDVAVAEVDRKEAAKQFSRDIRKHIVDIAEKYIIPFETADGAVMFIPAESVFAEIHGHYPELVELAYQKKVWLVSPTTLMAILTTATTVIKDEQTRQQVHIIQEHLLVLGKDFSRFQGRMDNLSKHIGQVSKDVEQVQTSARKISSRFGKIERVELTHEEGDEELERPNETNPVLAIKP